MDSGKGASNLFKVLSVSLRAETVRNAHNSIFSAVAVEGLVGALLEIPGGKMRSRKEEIIFRDFSAASGDSASSTRSSATLQNDWMKSQSEYSKMRETNNNSRKAKVNLISICLRIPWM